MTQVKTLLAQSYLHDVDEELTDLRKTLHQHPVAIRELQKGGDRPPSFVMDLLDVLVHRDRRLATRLANLHDIVSEAICLLAAAHDTELAPAIN